MHDGQSCIGLGGLPCTMFKKATTGTRVTQGVIILEKARVSSIWRRLGVCCAQAVRVGAQNHQPISWNPLERWRPSDFVKHGWVWEWSVQPASRAGFSGTPSTGQQKLTDTDWYTSGAAWVLVAVADPHQGCTLQHGRLCVTASRGAANQGS
eukprot:360381-Chlamydomonas_euryale.AAC.8